MIDPKELRIGNLVERCRIAPPWVVSEVLIYDFIGIEERKTQLRPIPISPEWLERLGFEKQPFGETGYWLPKSNIFFNHNDSNVIGYHIIDDFSDHLRHIKYIHQLQNLVFALTGAELTVKEPQTI